MEGQSQSSQQSPVRKLRLYFPADNSLLATNGRWLLPKLNQLKSKHEALSQRREYIDQHDPEIVYLNAKDIDYVNSSYRKIKRSRGETVAMRESQYNADPLYKSILDMKQRSRMQFRARSRHQHLRLSPA